MSDFNPATATGVPAPTPTYRLIPSRFPPVQAFDMAESADDLQAILDLEGWTNDRLSGPRLHRLPEREWVFGRANASVIMAAFLHGSPKGLRFSCPYLGAWYASSRLETAMLEILNGLRGELASSSLTSLTQEYREYTAELNGSFVDIRGGFSELHDPDVACYPMTQAFGEDVRASTFAGIAYNSVRDPDGENWVAYHPSKILSVTQARHYRIVLRSTGKVFVEQI
tara:strand:+ start:1180 stop:1857 length:678 start_codon:yes stop_codon:yes gene_type:complete